MPSLRSLPVVAAVACAATLPVCATARASAGAALEEITITARKIAETQQSASAAVTAIPGEALVAAGVLDLRGAQNLMPSVRFQAAFRRDPAVRAHR